MATTVASPVTAPTGPVARTRRGTGRLGGSWLGVAPFFAYVLVFMGLPLYEVLHGAFTNANGGLTFANFSATFTDAQYPAAFESSIILSLWTAAVGALFGTWFAAAVLTTSPRNPLRRIVTSASGVFAYFGGVPLAFFFIASLGTTGMVTLFLKDQLGIDLYAHGFTITSIFGIGLAYCYFQVPLMVILITPALEGLRPQWREAVQSLGGSQWSYLRHVAVPVLAPPFLASVLVLFGNSFAAYATALALVNGTVSLVPSQIQATLNGNVLVGQIGVGLALGVEMVVVIAVVMVLYGVLQSRARRWQR
jgi:putative spermidine/putrescine transport system permease protein